MEGFGYEDQLVTVGISKVSVNIFCSKTTAHFVIEREWLVVSQEPDRYDHIHAHIKSLI